MNPVLLAGLIVAAWLALAVAGTAVGTAIRFLRSDEYWDDRAQAELAEEETC